MDVSVVTPVYNAARFLEDAIASIIIQPEVKEILLIDDGSKDDSLRRCQILAEKYPIIRVLQHPDGDNRGAAATRNLGMAHARSDFIAFLDADDVYLQERFAATRNLSEQFPDADGIYETVVTKQLDNRGHDIDARAGRIKAGLTRTVSPRELFSTLAMAKEGYIHLDGLVIRKTALKDTLYFDPALRQSEDTDFLLRWAAEKTLYGGNPDRVVALRRIHETNTVFNTAESLSFRKICMRKCALQRFYGSQNKNANWEILNRMARATRLIVVVKRLHLPVTPFRLLIIGAFLLRHPQLMKYII